MNHPILLKKRSEKYFGNVMILFLSILLSSPFSRAHDEVSLPRPELCPFIASTTNGVMRTGYINTKGEVVIPPTLGGGRDFHNGAAVVHFNLPLMRPQQDGILDIHGNFIAPQPPDGSYQSVSDPRTGLFKVTNVEGSSVINAKGEIQFEGAFASRFWRNPLMAVFTEEGKFGVINNEGDIILPAIYTRGPLLRDDVIVVVEPGEKSSLERWRSSLFDRYGNVISKDSYCIIGTLSEGLMYAVDKQTFLTGYIDTSGTVVIPPQFRTSLGFHEELAQTSAVVDVDGVEKVQWGFIDKKGDFVIEPRFDRVSHFSEGMAAFGVTKVAGDAESTIWGFIDKTGTIIIEAQFDNYGAKFKNGYAVVSQNGKYGVIDIKGNTVVPIIYHSIDHRGAYFIADAEATDYLEFNLPNRRRSYYLPNGEIFDQYEEFGNGLILKVKNGVGGYVNPEGETVLQVELRYRGSYIVERIIRDSKGNQLYPAG